MWSRHIAAFMSSDFLFVGVPDHSSPVNGGVWLAKPRRWLYAESLALMRNCTFSFAHGNPNPNPTPTPTPTPNPDPDPDPDPTPNQASTESAHRAACASTSARWRP